MTGQTTVRIGIPLEELLQHNESMYKLVLLACRRTVELSQGAPPLVELNMPSAGLMALEEIRRGHVRYAVPTDEKKNPAKRKKA